MRQPVCCVPHEIVLIPKIVISVTKNMWYVMVHDGRMSFVHVVNSGNNKLLWRLLEEAMQRERSNKDDLRHLKLSITQCGILQHGDIIVRQSRCHDSIHPE